VSDDNGRRGPLDEVLRRHGATMVLRQGRCVAADFGSASSEAAVCVSTVGVADRFDRTTLELDGGPEQIETAIAAVRGLGDVAWWTSDRPRHVLVRCEGVDGAACAEQLRDAAGATVSEVTDQYASIDLIGPLAEDLLDAVENGPAELHPIVLQRDGSFDLLIDAARGPALWQALLDFGAPMRIACVGLDALEHLSASQRGRRAAAS
jgi:hypothetical protein